MKNHWLNTVIIEQQLAVPKSFPCYGKWYICKEYSGKYKYLHKDGLWWSSVYAENGYYDTKDEAEDIYAKSLVK